MTADVAIAAGDAGVVTVTEPLNAMESSAMLYQEPGITTITFFSSSSGENLTAAADYFRDRTGKILQANPWAAGKIVRISNQKNLQLVHPRQVSDELLDQVFVVAEKDSIPVHSEMSYDDICTAIEKSAAMLPSGTSCINNPDKLVTRITLIPTASNDGSFALVASMSHTCADGYTYYRILSMLSNNTPIEPLNAMRKPSLEATEVAWDPLDWKFVSTNIGFILNIVWGMLFGPKVKCFGFYLDEDKIATAKQEAITKGDVDFVSTNDILVATHSNIVQPRVQTMAINFRNRVEGAESSDAGNYEAAMLLDQGSYTTPTMVRQAVKAYETDATQTCRTRPLPGFWEAVRCKYGQLSNWASFFNELNLPLDGVEQELHLPILNLSKMPFDCAVIFKPKAGKTAIMYICKTPALLDPSVWQDKAPVGELVSTAVFG